MKLSDDFRTVVIITEKSKQYESRQKFIGIKCFKYILLQLVEKVVLIPLKRSERKGAVEDALGQSFLCVSNHSSLII